MKKIGLAVLVAAALAATGVKAQTTNVDVTVTNNMTLTWQWGTQHLFYATQPAVGGSITAPACNYYDNGYSVDMTANPAAHKKFKQWTGIPAGLETNNPVNFPLNEARMGVSAEFDDILYKLTVVSEGNRGNPRPGTTNVIYNSVVNQIVDQISTNGAPVGTRYKVKGNTITTP